MRTTNKIIDVLIEKANEINHTTEHQQKNIYSAWGKIEKAIQKLYGKKIAHEIGFHLTDWHRSAAFILAVCLAPENFTKNEIENEVLSFLSDAPNHVYTAARLTGDFTAKNTFYRIDEKKITNKIVRNYLKKMKENGNKSELKTFGRYTVWFSSGNWKVLDEKDDSFNAPIKIRKMEQTAELIMSQYK